MGSNGNNDKKQFREQKSRKQTARLKAIDEKAKKKTTGEDIIQRHRKDSEVLNERYLILEN